MTSYPANEKCDWCMCRTAVFRVLDSRRYEVAVCCRECVPHYAPTFEDCDGNVFNP